MNEKNQPWIIPIGKPLGNNWL